MKQLSILSPAIGQQDDRAVDELARAMKEKLAKKRGQGFFSWRECSSEEISKMLIAHVEKGDPIDVANFCAMLIAKQSQIIYPVKQAKLVISRVTAD